MVETYRLHWHAYVQKNYDDGLDFYVKCAFDVHVYKYQLIMPAMDHVVDDNAIDAGEPDGYPHFTQYYLATGKTYVCRYTPAEWAAMGDTTVGPVAAIAPAEPIGAGVGTDTMDTVEPIGAGVGTDTMDTAEPIVPDVETDTMDAAEPIAPDAVAEAMA